MLLDHGLYFDLADDLRINYSKFWLSLMASPSEDTSKERRKYARLVGNIDEDLYPIFEAAITGKLTLYSLTLHSFKLEYLTSIEGRASMDESPDGPKEHKNKQFTRGGSLIELEKQTDAEIEAIRNAVASREGLILDVFSVLRRVPKRVLMVLKLNDLTRSLDHALATTHSNVRVATGLFGSRN